MTRALHPIAADTCPECNGRGWFYCDAGPSGDTETCSYCDGAGSWDDLGIIESAAVRSPACMGSSFDGDLVSPAVAAEFRDLGQRRAA